MAKWCFSHIFLLFFGCLTVPLSAQESPCAGKPGEGSKLEDKLKESSEECRAASLIAERCCRDPKSSGCGYRETGGVPANLPSEGSYGAAVQQSGRLLKAKNDSNAFAGICKSSRDKAKVICNRAEVQKYIKEKADTKSEAEEEALNKKYSATIDTAGKRNEILANYEKCHRDQAEANNRDLEKSLESANESMVDSRWRSNCIETNVEGVKTNQCFLTNDGMNSGGIVSGKDRDDLPVQAVKIEGCSGYTNTSGNLSTAAHCNPPGGVASSVREGPDGEKQVAAWQDRKGEPLNFYEATKQGLSPYEDASKYTKVEGTSDPSFSGKPYYTLSRDPAMSSGCQVRGDELACSESALREIQGTEATIQGYPKAYFNETKTSRNPAQDQLVTRGPAYYDSYSGNVRVNAYGSQGNSGGPVSLPVQTTIGGVTTDRPVVIGPVSTVYTGGSVYNNPTGIGLTSRTTNVPVITGGRPSPYYRVESIDATLLDGGSIFKNPLVGGKK